MADQTFEVELRIDLNAPNLRGELSRALGDLNQSVTGFDQKIAGVQKNLDGATKATKGFEQGLSTTRYALYDVSSTLAVTGAALLGVAVATTAVAVAWERDFANVARTSGLVGGALQDLRTEFVDLAQTMPTSFADLTKIGTLGSQLGVASKDLASFTQTVVRFSTATGISAQESAMAFGRLGNILGVTSDQYEKLGSSIAFAGLKAVATEAEIVAVAQQIGPIARLSGVAADGVIGLATAMASVKIPPELARSVITKTFGDIQKAVETTSPKLAAFGEVAGMSGAEFQKAWRTDATGTFVELLKGITTNGEGAYAALDKIGITSRRDTPALLKLAQNYQLVGESLRNSETGWTEGTELARQYGIIAETTAAKLQVLANNFMALLDAIGSANLGPLGTILDGLSNFLGVLTDFASSDIGGPLLGFVAVMTGLVGVLALAAGAMALFGASTIGVQQAINGLVLTSPKVAAAMLGTSTAAAVASGSMTAAAASARALGTALKAISIVGVLLILPDLLGLIGDGLANLKYGAEDAGRGLEDAFDRILKNTDSLADKLGKTEFTAAIKRALSGISSDTLLQDLKQVDEGLAELAKNGNADLARERFDALKAAWSEGGHDMAIFRQAMTDTNNALKESGPVADATKGSFATLQEGMDAIATEAQEAEQAINELREAVLNFGAETISVEQSQIALSRAINGLAEAAANGDATLDGTNAASLALRDSFIDVDKAARDAALAILDSGGTMEDAARKYQEGRDQIIAARIAKGEDATAAGLWADSILGSTQEARDALQAYHDKVNATPEYKTTRFYVDASGAYQSVDNLVAYIQSRRPTLTVTEVLIEASRAMSGGRGRLVPGAATGGYISGPGTATSDSIPARLSNGEYVIKAAAVQKYGTAFFHALNSAKVPKFASGGQVGTGSSGGGFSGVVELGPKSLARITQSVTNNILIDDEAISRSSQRGDQKRRASGDL